MSDTAVRVENLSKRYRIGGPQARYKTLRESLVDAARAPARRLRRLGHPSPENETIWALKDVSFEVKKGDVLGIIGRNGAGKTTLLRILCRITEPTEGHAEIKGRVGSLLEVGTGFHPELTGRENIYLNGAILGMKRAEIDQKFDEIVAFSEIEKFLDTPVKRYSSGMYVRLAFSVAAHLEPEILLVDEVLAVGDAAFQKKCLGKMGDVAGEGRTVLFVSHNMAAVENLCQRGVVLDEGRIRYIGSQDQAIEQYLRSIAGSTPSLRDRIDRRGSGAVRVVAIEVRDTHGNVLPVVTSGQDVDVYLHYETTQDAPRHNVLAGLSFRTQLDTPVFLQHNRLTGDVFEPLPPQGAFVCRVLKLPLPPSTYRIGYSIMPDDGRSGQYLDSLGDAATLTVVDGDFFGSGEVPPATHGSCLVSGSWRVEPGNHLT
jgi:lipopolysaccharide transport system ATP-binding protein